MGYIIVYQKTIFFRGQDELNNIFKNKVKKIFKEN